MEIGQINEIVRADDQAAECVRRLEAIGPPPFAVALPAVDDLAPVLLDLAVPREDIDPLIALRPDREQAPDLWWLTERGAHALVRQLGTVGSLPDFPPLL